MAGGLAPAREHDIRLPEGRVLHAYESGDQQGEPVIVHHGTPGSGVLWRSWAEDAAARGIRLIGYDRPGYGGSQRHPGRRVADAAGDVAALADALAVQRFRTWGTSGGGPHALACAALLPDRVIAAATLAGVGPSDADGLDFLAGMGGDNVEEFGAARAGEQALQDFLAPAREAILAATAQSLGEEMATLLPPVDLAVLRGECGQALHASMVEGLRGGHAGWFDDDLAFVHAWGFDPARLGVPVLVRQGEADLMVPVAHGRWLATRLPRAEAALTAGDGHLTLVADLAETHRWLLDQR